MWEIILQMLQSEAMKDAGGKNSAGGIGLGMLSKNMGQSRMGGGMLSKGGEQFDPNDTEFTRKRNSLMSKGMSY